MSKDSTSLRRALVRLRARETAVNWVVTSGRLFLTLAVLTLPLVVVRRFFLEVHGREIVPLSALELVLLTAAALLGLPLLLRLVSRFRRPSLPAVARTLDARLELLDLLPSGLAASRAAGALAPAMARRASRTAASVDPSALYPARRSLARMVGSLVLVLAAVYLLDLPGDEGWIPIPGDEIDWGLPLHDAVDVDLDPVVREEEPDRRPLESPEETEGAPPDRMRVRVVPVKKIHVGEEPVLVYVTVDPIDPLSRAREFEVLVAVDEVQDALQEKMTVRPEPEGGTHLTADLRTRPGLAPKLTPGTHRLRAILEEGGRVYVSEPVEIEILGEPGGGGGPDAEPPAAEEESEPQPGAGAGSPPPPEVIARPRFVMPLFRAGETVEKEGWALVPDPAAPPGSPPRRLPVEEAVRKAGRRPESPVPSERLSPEDRATVSEYFNRLREGR